MSESYVALRDGEAVRLKRCDDCGGEFRILVSQECAFYLMWDRRGGRLKPRWSRFCKECTRRQKREAYAADPETQRQRATRTWERLKSDPERYAATRLRDNEAQRRRMADPARRERSRAASRRWKERKKAEDPNYFSRANRERRRLAAEERRRRRSEERRGYGRRVPAEPFRRWVRAYMVATQTFGTDTVAVALRIPARRLYAVMAGEQENVAFDSVDRALVSANRTVFVDGRGIFTIDDLYPIEMEEAA